MQRFIAKVGWFQMVVRDFQCEVNHLLNEGYQVLDLKIERKCLRFICIAILAKDGVE